MTGRFSHLHAVVLLACAVFAGTPSYAEPTDFQVIRRDADVYFTGPISAGALRDLEKALSEPTARLIVTSAGGDARAGQAIARLLLKHPVDVVVEKYCLSACANYVFLFGRQKWIADGAFVGFQGGLSTGNATAGSAQALPVPAELADMYQTEHELFAAIQVDHALIAQSDSLAQPAAKTVRIVVVSKAGAIFTFSKEQEAQATQKVQELFAAKNLQGMDVHVANASSRVFYFPSRATLQRFGVSGVHAFHYPDSAGAMRALGKRTLEGLELLGDPVNDDAPARQGPGGAENSPAVEHLL